MCVFIPSPVRVGTLLEEVPGKIDRKVLLGISVNEGLLCYYKRLLNSDQIYL